MTENEAIKVLKDEHSYGYELNEACLIAIKALEEIQQYRAIGKVEEVKYLVDSYNGMIHDFGDDMSALEQYRAIGTVEEIKTAMKYVSLAKKHGTVGKAIDSCAEYEAIGTIEEFKDLKEKATPMKPIPNKPLEEGRVICWSCPNCGKENWNGYYFPPLTFDKVCTDCLQTIDWE